MRVLVPLDRSEFAEHALGHALGLMAPGDTLGLVTSIEPMMEPMGGIPDVEARLEEAAHLYLNEVAAKLGAAMEVEAHVATGPAWIAVRDVAEEWNADLIVMTTHGRGPLSRFWLGSVADRLVTMSTLPLYLVRPDPEGDHDPLAPVAAPDSVVVPVDGSSMAESALDALPLLGAHSGRTVHLVRVQLFPHALVSPYLPHTVAANIEATTDGRDRATRYLSDLIERTRAGGLDVDGEVVEAEFVAPAIREFAESRGADAIALTSHGASGLRRMALGSVADKLVRRTTRPILIVRNADASDAD